MKLSPFHQATSLYPSQAAFKRDLHRALTGGGHVIISPTLIMIGYEVPRGRSQYVRPWDRRQYAGQVCDTWLVWLAAGDLAETIARIPHPLPRIAFARRGTLREYSFEEITRAVLRQRHKTRRHKTQDLSSNIVGRPHST